MCGILAVFNNDYSEAKFKKALDLMIHRGPDCQSVKMIDNNLLGHLRLSIIDIDKRSNQPFSKNNFHIIYNGEIYNYKELIVDHNLVVETKSDTEVVLEMYKKYGVKCLQYFNGMFAFVIYNKNNKDVFIARDRLGIKPLYTRIQGERIEVSSEIEPLLYLQSSKLDDFGLRQYRKLRMTIKGFTIYEDIKTFPAGFYYLNGKFKKYWELNIERKPPPSDEYLKYLIEDSIYIRKRSDVSLGSYLSGGLDSTILSYVLKPANTWTVGFEDMNEFSWATLANKGLNSKLHQILVSKQEFLDTCAWMVKKRKEPLSVPNEVLIYLMTKKVKMQNTVVLSGEGADELFFGYDRIFRWANSVNDFDVDSFDMKYCYGSNKDDEVIDFALEGLCGDSPLDKIAYFFQIFHLQGLLRRLDNSTMLCSVEARVPFVDHRLVELMAGTPFDWRMGSSFKEPLKRLFYNLIPEETINRKKIGFPVPLESMFSSSEKMSPMDGWLEYNLNLINNLV